MFSNLCKQHFSIFLFFIVFYRYCASYQLMQVYCPYISGLMTLPRISRPPQVRNVSPFVDDEIRKFIPVENLYVTKAEQPTVATPRMNMIGYVAGSDNHVCLNDGGVYVPTLWVAELPIIRRGALYVISL
jgi:hypothetical protein